MLSEEQIEVIAEALIPLFNYLEREVIIDIAERIQKTMAYTRTAELKAISMRELGYSPAKIRKECMRLLNSDEKYRKAVAKNTLEHKREVRNLLNEIMKEAYRESGTVIKDSADTSYLNDLAIWRTAGKELKDDSYLSQLVKSFHEQTKGELKNISRTTGFKSVNGYEAIESAYQRELDKALIKICSGTFSKEEVIRDTIHNLAGSGLRTVKFESGYSMHIDTAVRNAVRTSVHQMQGKMMDENIRQTGEEYVYVSKHWGARNKGTGHANHEEWQGKVYAIAEGDHAEEAKRIGYSEIEDLYDATGYSADGCRVNDPLGLYGYNCRHSHRVWFAGISDLTDFKEDPEPAPVTIGGKTYDYYAVTQKMRSMERGIRALKKERDALKAMNLDTKDIDYKIRRRTEEYKDFCKAAKVKEKTERLRYECSSANLKKTEAWKEMHDAIGYAKSNDLGERVYYNEKADYKIEIKGYENKVNKGLSRAAKEVAIEGSKDGNEHMRLVNLKTGELECAHTDGMQDQVGGKIFYDYLRTHGSEHYAFIHNHNVATELSLSDVELIANNKQIKMVAAVRNDGIISYVTSNGKHTNEYLILRYEKEWKEYIQNKRKEGEATKNVIHEIERELFYRDLVINDFCEGEMMTNEYKSDV